jgi:hypothetical protein
LNQARRQGASQQIFRPGKQFAGVEGLDHIVIGTELQCHDPVDVFALAGDHDDANLGLSADLAQQRKTVFVRQVDVQQDQIHITPGEEIAHGYAIGCGADLVAFFADVGRQCRAGDRIVFDDQDMAIGKHEVVSEG